MTENQRDLYRVPVAEAALDPTRLPYQISREIEEAFKRRGVECSSTERFFIQRKSGDRWLNDTECAIWAEVVPEIFAARVASNPKVEWRIMVRHVTTVETTLVLHSIEVRG